MTSDGFENTRIASRVDVILESTTNDLSAGGVENPTLKAEWLVAHVLHCGRLELHERKTEFIGIEIVRALASMTTRLCTGEPLQYVLGETDFMGHNLMCDSRALIPRPETEGLVDLVLQTASIWDRPEPRVADIGTGSGCIAIALAKARPEALIFGVDKSYDVLSLACANANRCELDGHIVWQDGHLLKPFPADALDAVVANLPYIPTADCDRLPREVRDFEPRAALDGGHDGLRLIAELIEQAPRVVRTDGKLFLEIGEEQTSDVIDLMQEAGWRNIEAVKDLAERDRIVHGTAP